MMNDKIRYNNLKQSNTNSPIGNSILHINNIKENFMNTPDQRNMNESDNNFCKENQLKNSLANIENLSIDGFKTKYE